MSRLVALVFAPVVIVALTPLAPAQHRAHSGHPGHSGHSSGGMGNTVPRTPPPAQQTRTQPTQQFTTPNNTLGGTPFQSMSSNTLGLNGSRLGTTRPGFGFGIGFVGSGTFGSTGPVNPQNFSAPLTGYPFPPAEPGAVLVKEFPATLTVQLPPTSEMWLDGKTVTADQTDEHVLTSPDLKPGEEYTFKVKIRWTRSGKTYEANREVTLGPGEKSRLLIVSGEEVKE